MDGTWKEEWRATPTHCKAMAAIEATHLALGPDHALTAALVFVREKGGTEADDKVWAMFEQACLNLPDDLIQEMKRAIETILARKSGPSLQG